MKSKKFENVPVEAETHILVELMHNINGIEVLFQTWRWGEYLADSIIFQDKDVEGMTEDEIVNLVRQDTTCRKDSKITFSQNGNGYTFVNFNFELDEPDFSIDREEFEKKMKKDQERIDRWKREIRERDETYKKAQE